MNQIYRKGVRRNTVSSRPFASVLFSLFFAFLAGSVAFAQSADSGRILGRVQDAASGKYMENVVVTLNGSGESVKTGSDGTFRLGGVSSGSQTLSIFHVGFFAETVNVNVSNGDVARVATVQLRSRNSYDDSGEVYELEAYKVRNEVDAYSRAINQQKVSDYNVNVVDSGAFGDVTEGNVGEFVKSLPGVNINYVAADARTITVRGMADNFTAVTVDGNRMASAASGAKARDFELEQLSINNVERVEVAKVPTPDMAADALGGAVNLVSKNAFERDGRQIKYRVYLSANSEDMSFGSSPGWDDGKHNKIQPGFDLTYADVFQDGRLGMIFNYTNSNQFNEQHRSRTRWVTDNSGEGIGTPIFRRYMIQDGPKFTHRESYHVKADYKLSENTVLSGSLQFNDYSSEFRNRNVTWDTNITSTTDSDANDDGLISTTEMLTDTGRADIDLGGSWRNKYGDTWHGSYGVKHFGEVWTYDLGGFVSSATNFYDDFSNGMVMAVIGDNDVPGQVGFTNFGDPFTGPLGYVPTLTVYNPDGSVDPGFGISSLAEFDLDEIQTREQHAQDDFYGFNFDMKRNIRIGDNSGYFKMGARTQTQKRHAKRNRIRLRHVDSTYDDTGLPAEQYYSGEDALYIGPGIIQWPDYEDIYDYYAANPDNFEWGSRTAENVEEMANQKYNVEEKITAAYMMGQLKFMDSRLKFTGGLRYEKTELTGTGGYFDESLGTGIADEQARLLAQWSQRLTARTEYDDIHPSLHMVYDFNERFLMRLAYANTIGRPNYSAIVPQLEIDRPDEDEDEQDGVVEFNNTTLTPQNADNLDLTFEYYPSNGGVLSAGLFRKSIEDYIVSAVGTIGDLTDAEFAAFYLPNSLRDTPAYSYATEINGGKATIEGLELSYFQSLKQEGIPDWLRAFSFNVNATFIGVEQDLGNGSVSRELEDLVKQTYNVGLTYDRDPWKVQLKWNSKGEQLVGSFNDMRTYRSDGGYDPFGLYRAPLEQLDINLDFDLTDKSKIFLSGRNILNDPQNQFVANADRSIIVPERSEEFGIQWAFGVKGEF